MNFRYRLMQFMSGRYGIDTTFYILFAVSAVLSLINCFVRSTVLQIIVYLIVLIAFYRMFSRNIAARSSENHRVVQFTGKLKQRVETRRQRNADTTHVYKKCPCCKAVLRLPRRKGKHNTVCPKCGTSFSVRVFKN